MGKLAMTNPRRASRPRRLLLCSAALSVLASPAAAQFHYAAAAPGADLSDLSLEELANLEITSVSRRAEPISQAAAAAYMINSEDIRRSGATSLPEVLRLAPNLQVQRVNAADYAISARGFNGFESSNKLLVMLDGRSVYSTLHAGVFWDIRTPMLEDIEQIEVVSGPGGTLFGANAVNGVINVITRDSFQTKGGLLNLGAGNEDRTLSARYGWGMGDAGAARAYVYAFDRDTSLRADGADATDDTSGVRGGVRTDWRMGADTFTAQGEVYRNRMRTNEDFAGDGTHADGAHILGRWTHAFQSAGELQVQAYYDHMELVEPLIVERGDAYDLHIQHAISLGDHALVWGGGYRETATELVSMIPFSFADPQERTVILANLFVQDQIALSDALTLTLGVKYEDNNFSGQEVLPNARIAWRLRNGDLLWAAASRASRTPNRIERDLRVPGFLAAGDFQSELLTAYEAGYRSNPTADTSISVSAFYNEYDDLRTVRPDPVTIAPIVFANDAGGRTFGLEAWGSWDVRPRWRLSAGVATLDKDFQLKEGASDISDIASIGNDPDYQVSLRSQSSLTDSIELDLRLRAVGELDRSDVGDYVEADARLGWRLTDTVELAVAGQNLLDDQRLETADPQRRRYFGRSVYANLRWTF